MAENVTVNPGASGDVIAADDIGGVKFPRSKITIGADGVNDGDVSAANPLPIKGTGTAGTPNAGVVTVQGIASGTAIPVSGTFTVGTHDVTNAGTFAVQASQAGVWNIASISGTVSLPTGAATSALQATGNASLASMDGKITAVNTGAVVVSSSALPTGAATSAKQDTLIGHVDGLEGLLTTIDGDTGNISTKIDTLAGAVAGSEMQADVVTTVTPTDRTASGTITALDGSVAMAVPGCSSATVQLSGTWDAEITFEVTSDNTTWITVPVMLATGSDTTVSATSPYIYTLAVGGYSQVRARAAAYTSGTVAVTIRGSAGPLVIRTMPVTLSGGPTGIGKEEDATHLSGDVGIGAWAVRTDTPANRSNADGRYEPLQVSGGRLWTSTLVTGTVTVGGTVTANAGTNLNTSALALETTATAIKTAVETLDNAIAGSEMQVDVVTSALPSGAATSALQTTGNASLASIDGKITAVDTGAVVVSSSALPSGASTAAKQPALGTAGSAAVDVLSVQGIASMTPLKVDGSATTQPVSGTVTANAGTNLNTSALALETTLTSIKTSVELLDNTVAGSEIQVDVLTMPTVTVNSHAVTNAGTFAVQVSSALPAGTNAIGKLAANSGVDIGDVDVTSLPALAAGTNNIGDVDVLSLPAIPAGSNNIGDVDVLTLPALVTGTATIGAVQLKPVASGGLTAHKTISAASTNATSVKASAGQLYEIFATNVNASPRYLKLYNKASSPTVGTDTPIWTLLIPGNTAGAGLAKTIPIGLAFATGIAFALTTGVADADTAAVAANEIVINLGYS